jgi:hypothetical protein
MADKTFSNELQRVLARPDVEKLREQLGTYRSHSRTEWPDGANEDMDAVMSAHWDDPERGLAYVVLAMAEYDDPEFLALMSAGLLENLLQDPEPELLSRIAAEARKTARLRWMLGIPFRHAIPDRVWERIKDYVIEDVDRTPLPPPPVA